MPSDLGPITVVFADAATPAITAAPGDAGDGRTITGVAVPWGEVGTVADGSRVRFLPGSLDASARPPVLRDHDLARPLGRIVAAADTGAGLEVTARISRVPAGDEALILAADGVLAAFSVGVDPIDHRYDGDVLEVVAGEWRELSLLTMGAFAGAQVTDVAASSPTSDLETAMPTTAEAGAHTHELDTDTDAGPPAETLTAGVAPPAVVAALEASARRPEVVPLHANARPAPNPVGLREVAAIIAGAERRGLRADAVQAEIRAVLDNVTTTEVGGGLVPPTYLTEIRGIVNSGRPTVTAIGGAQSLPASGMAINYPEWTALPHVAEQTAEKTEINSDPATLTMRTEPVRTFAGANDISLQAVERSSPSFLEAYLRAMSADYARKTNQALVDRLVAAANVVTPPATPTWLNIFPALIGGLDPALTPDGPLFVAMSWNIGLSMLGVSVNNGPAFWEGQISLTGVEPSLSGPGLVLYVERQLPANTMLAGSPNGATFYENPGAPADIRVVDVSLLGLDVGVYGYAAITVDYPESFSKVTLTAPPGDAPATTSSGRSKSS